MDDFGNDLPISQGIRNGRQSAGRRLIMDFESDTDMDDSELSTIDEEDERMDSSDTSDDDVWYIGGGSGDEDLSDASSDSSLSSSYNGEGGASHDIFELMSQHLDMFNHEADSFFRVSLRTLYETLMEFMEEKGGPTPPNILQSLPSVKVTLAQIASNAACPICFAEYEQEEDLIKLPCNHDYHKDCIYNWLKLKSTCPTCRLDLAKSQNTRVREDNVEDVDLSDIDSLLITNNNTSDEAISIDSHSEESGNSSQNSSTDNIHSSASSSQSSSSIVSLTSTSSGESINELRLFSRSTSPVVIDSSDSETSSFSSKVSIVEPTTTSSSTQSNKRQTNTDITNHLPAKRKSKETEIW